MRAVFVAVAGLEWRCRGEDGVCGYWMGAAERRRECIAVLGVHSGHLGSTIGSGTNPKPWLFTLTLTVSLKEEAGIEAANDCKPSPYKLALGSGCGKGLLVSVVRGGSGNGVRCGAAVGVYQYPGRHEGRCTHRGCS